MASDKPSGIDSGILLIADISGYTEYLAGADLEHAPIIATDLLTRVVDSIHPTFEVNKLEGDAVFASSRSDVTGDALLAVIDQTYGAFRNRLIGVSQATSCGCMACEAVPNLDLKLIAHWGNFKRERIAGRDELVGREVIVVHRLLKNTLGFAGPASGYVMITDDCTRALEFDPKAQGLAPHTESYDHLGEVEVWFANLEERVMQRPPWQPATPPLHVATALFNGSLPQTWEVLAPGRSDSCVSHRLASVMEIIEWKPYKRLVVEVERPEARVVHEVQLEAEGLRTRAEVRWYRGRRHRGAVSWDSIGKDLATSTAETLSRAGRHLDRAG